MHAGQSQAEKRTSFREKRPSYEPGDGDSRGLGLPLVIFVLVIVTETMKAMLDIWQLLPFIKWMAIGGSSPSNFRTGHLTDFPT